MQAEIPTDNVFKWQEAPNMTVQGLVPSPKGIQYLQIVLTVSVLQYLHLSCCHQGQVRSLLELSLVQNHTSLPRHDKAF